MTFAKGVAIAVLSLLGSAEAAAVSPGAQFSTLHAQRPAQRTVYAEPNLLVDTTWVAGHSGDPVVRLVDMRDATAYAAGRIPGAVRVEEGPLRNPEDRLTYLPRPEALAAMM